MEKQVYIRDFCFQDKQKGSAYISPRQGCFLSQALHPAIGYSHLDFCPLRCCKVPCLHLCFCFAVFLPFSPRPFLSLGVPALLPRRQHFLLLPVLSAPPPASAPDSAEPRGPVGGKPRPGRPGRRALLTLRAGRDTQFLLG